MSPVLSRVAGAQGGIINNSGFRRAYLGRQGVAGYSIARSLRFNSGDSASLTKTFGSEGSRTTWTWSAWVKGGGTGTLFGCTDGGSNDSTYQFLYIDGDYQLHLNGYSTIWRWTTRVFRDPAAWWHVVLVWDTNNGTAQDRIRIYINGEKLAASEFGNANSNPSSGASSSINRAAQHVIGNSPGGYFNGYLADVHFVDGSALDASSFGETDAATGVWNPKAYSGTYGTNGFHLDFADNSSAGALGYDEAGSNDWTVNNLSVTTGAGNDSLRDSPTNGTQTDTGVGGEVVGNYCTWNSLSKLGNNANTLNISNGNLTFTTSANLGTTGTFGMTTGKWYWELTCTALTRSQLYFGITNITTSDNRVDGTCSIRDTGGLYNINGATTNGSGSAAMVAGDVVRFAYDGDNKRLFIALNGTWLNSSDPATGTGATYTDVQGAALYPLISDNNTTATIDANFGQRAFAYQAPSGFKALCTANLPAPSITKPSTVMDVALYTGNGGTNTITGLGFSPDFVWIKPRSAAYDHIAFDTVRGTLKALFPNLTNQENSNFTGTLTAFNSDGYTIGSQTQINESSTTFASWCWDAGSSNATNNSGGIQSTVRANTSAGFSVVTGNFPSGDSSGTIGHGLGVKPGLIFLKSRVSSEDWFVHHSALAANQALLLNSTAAIQTSTAYWNNQLPTSTVFSIGGALSNGNFVAYCFAPVTGYSSFGSYTGNGSSDGPFIYTGFRPRWIMIKNTTTGGAGLNWLIHDTARDTYNQASTKLYANLSIQESTEANNQLDIISNGFKLRSANTTTNTNTDVYIYAAFAETPLNYSRAR